MITGLNKHPSDTILLENEYYGLYRSGSHYFVQVLLLCPKERPKENKWDDQTNSIKPNLLNPIQTSKIPVPLKMLHPLVLIPAVLFATAAVFFTMLF